MQRGAAYDEEYAWEHGWEVPPAAHDLKFPHGEGADSFYSAPSSFKRATDRTGRSFASRAQRFEGNGSYLDTREVGGFPGPGAYQNSGAIPRPASYDRALSFGPPSRSPERIRYKPSEGADCFYDIKGTFGEKARRRVFEGFGTAERFSKVNSYIGGDDSVPGPGQYLVTQSERGRGKGPRVVAPVFDRSERLSYAQRDGGEMMYNVKSQFDKYSKKHGPSAAMGMQPRFSRAGAEDVPGPGAYKASEAKRKISRRTDAGTPVIAPSQRYSDGRLKAREEESPGPVYEVKGTFDKAAKQRIVQRSFGTSPRFVGLGDNPPGPGAYHPKTAPVRPRSAAPAFAGPNMRPPGWTAAHERRRK